MDVADEGWRNGEETETTVYMLPPLTTHYFTDISQTELPPSLMRVTQPVNKVDRALNSDH